MVENPIRIASYNIRKARGLDQKRRPERTLQVINALQADVVVLQEADKRMGSRHPAVPRRMIETETDYALVEVATNGISLGWHGNAILVRKQMTVKDVHRVDLPGLEPRGAVRIDLDHAGGMTLVATHLGLLRADRRAQLERLCGVTAGSSRTVIAGDFNEWSYQKGLEPLEPRFEVHAPGRTFHARRPIAALDRFAVSQGVQLRQAGVSRDALARRASDHLPIWFDLDLSPALPIC